MTALLVALGAAAGAALRFEVASRYDGRFPVGTLAVNVSGSFLLGLLSALALGQHPLALLGTGFCGGFTTYSAFAVQTHGLGRLRATAYAVATIGGALVACALGFTIGQA
ncbi:fluoride efflux transporter CrcB [Nocardioides hankookensis]|uniref:Fluoride-specific ion channel FluC n=1 Tax=Nocardioides hankookensis TaxID=443157 RepID=A0ABW1LLK7_9ACTN